MSSGASAADLAAALGVAPAPTPEGVAGGAAEALAAGRAALEAAQPVLAGQAAGRRDTRGRQSAHEAPPDPAASSGDADDDDRPAGAAGLPPDCPVVPLGKDGEFFYYLDAQGQYRPIKDEKHGRLKLQSLAAPQTEWLWKVYPRYNKDQEVVGWQAEAFAEDLMNACASRPPWDPRERLRGRGAWRGEQGGLVLHLGNRLIWRPMNGSAEVLPTGLLGRHVYPSAAPLPGPAEGRAWHDDASQGKAAAHALLDLFGCWKWQRGARAARLLLGWVACGMIGGALDWRPAVWITAPFGSGKSTLQDVLEQVLDGGLLKVEEPTAAGVRQVLKLDTLPVLLDESEAGGDGRKLMDLVRLARLAASGGRIIRGGADHEATEFIARSSFAFSSILIPPLAPQDRSRIAVLDLDPLDADAKEPVVDRLQLNAAGAAMRRRLIEYWPDFMARLAAFKDQLRRVGHSSRSAAQYGALLAAADVLLEDEGPGLPETWAAALAGYSRADLAFVDDEEGGDAADCLSHLCSSVLELGGGTARRTVAGWVRYGVGREEGLFENVQEANKVLGLFGLKIVSKETRGSFDYLAVANKSAGLAGIMSYTGSPWTTPPGGFGGWVQSLRRLPGAIATDGVRYDGRQERSTLVPLHLVGNAPTPTPKGTAE